MGALKKLKKKLSSASSKKKFMNNDTNSKNTKTVLGDVTNASPGKSNKRGKTLKPFRTADVSSAKRSNTGGVSLKAVEIFEDDEAFEQRREGGSKAPPPSSASDSVSPASSKSSKSALDEWADHLILPVLLPVGGFNENKEEEKEQPETPTKTTDDDKDDDDEEVMNVVDSGFAASPIVVSYELSESECGTPGEVEERVLGNVESVVLANDNEAVDVAEEEGEDALESYLFTPPPVNLAKKDTLKEDAVEEEKKNTNTQSARLSSSMWDVKMMHNVSFMKNVSAMDVAMGAGAAAVVFNFFMPSFLKASF
ncbi:unknown protein [Bathycoccus prasinos]|jgi:hypothetical protein|uniref:Uncharacterized protein n=1 Tax=Bathycoccus prasinos TaxID=41875 RepID=K8EAQ7_9CHLO|nr:unknown protein [Bathycoccus prasinos]CCO14856.1 unknown protein [Bathycoccus prasinos]|eukprot:XP_007514616.1 unknown protein [Bathycoccus prasinos]